MWSTRDSATTPTKSAIVGLLACCMGASDDDTLASISRGIRIGIRCDRPGLVMQEYQTVGNGYPAHLTGDGKVKKSVGGDYHVEEVHKTYLADACFVIGVLSDDDDLIERLVYAVQYPVWPYYLGRRDYIPSKPVYAGVKSNCASLEDALTFFPYQGADDSVRAQIECNPDHPGCLRINDEIVSRTRRIFSSRYYYDVSLRPEE